jgi:hypothetical protein
LHVKSPLTTILGSRAAGRDLRKEATMAKKSKKDKKKSKKKGKK